MKTPSILAAAMVLLASTSAHAIDAQYRRLLERSGCTQVSETQGCDIHKTKKQNAKAGFVPDTPGNIGTRVAEQACLKAVAKTVHKSRSLLSVSEVLPAGPNTTVMVIVPGANAPWSCLTDAKGHVKSTMFTGKDGD
ncbi:hypothetical protein [uncultured Thiodictyon sp.]|uniref:hypothetical protein n=1 Tax=uncultured Thiodictyon sp. TaxID=1846217 RepID=UPI0025D80A79|nr:hypothetical protein [uncultured Thiodictyon sp.]